VSVLVSRVVEEDLRLTKSLKKTTKEYVDLKRDRSETAVKLYKTFLKNYVFQFPKDKGKSIEVVKDFFKKEKIRIAAIDGTRYERSRRGCIVFYVLASTLIYDLDLGSSDCKLRRIEEESVRNNVMVLIPVPLSEIFLLGMESATEETEEVEEKEEEELGDFFAPQKIGKIDLALMKLAEVYTIIWCLKNVKPDVIMIDGSLFQEYSYSNRSIDRLSLYKGEILGIRIKRGDLIIFKSFPINSELKIPSPSFTREFLIAELLKSGKIELNEDLTFHSNLINDEVSITRIQLNHLKELECLEVEEKEGKVIITLKDPYKESWSRLKELFLKVCEEGFGKNNLEAFKVYFPEEEKKSYRYMCEEDIETLCRIGYNMIIEECWSKNVLLFSITKDSYVRFFVDNFLTIGGPRHLGVFQFDQKLLPRVPSTDSGMLYDISVRTNDLHPPLALMEYDPAISTIYSSYDSDTNSYTINQLRRIAQERQFLRSLVQISEDSIGRKSLVFTVDRITYPNLDRDLEKLNVNLGGKNYEFAYYTKPSKLLSVIVSLIHLTSSNKHDAVFGYPDPLFEIDQYVKTVGRAHLETLDITLTEIDLEEFSVTYRQLREMGGG
jgi:hypothetical protein